MSTGHRLPRDGNAEHVYTHIIFIVYIVYYVYVLLCSLVTVYSHYCIL